MHQAGVGVAVGEQRGRRGLLGDVGGAVTALLSDGSRWINAQRIEVSGGTFI